MSTANVGNALYRAALARRCPTCGAPPQKECPSSPARLVCDARWHVQEPDGPPVVLTLPPGATWDAPRGLGDLGLERAQEPDRDTKPGKWDGVNAARARARAAGRPERTGAEARFVERLERLVTTGEVVCWIEQPCSLRLADGLHYRPDFLAVESSGLVVFWEVKGQKGWTLDAKGRAKWLAAAERHRWAEFRAALWGGAEAGWTIETYTPRGAWPPEGGAL